jgi:hypothetical protein
VTNNSELDLVARRATMPSCFLSSIAFFVLHKTMRQVDSMHGMAWPALVRKGLLF